MSAAGRHIAEFTAELADHAAAIAELQEGGGSGSITSPLQIPDCALWLDASQIVGLSDGDAVATWADESGNSYDAAQATANNKPVYKTAIRNGKPVVRFNQATHLQFLSFAGAGLDLFRNLDGFTIFLAAFNTDMVDGGYGLGVPANYFLSASDGDSNGYARLSLVAILAPGPFGVVATNRDSVDADSDSPQAAQIAQVQGGFTAPTPAWVPNNASFAINCVTAECFPEGGITSGGNGTVTFEEAAGPLADTPSDTMQIGRNVQSTAGLSSDIGELIVFQRALTASERRQVREYLSAKWATL